MQYQLHQSQDGVALTWEGVNWRSLRVNFNQGRAGYRLAHLSKKKELIAKAIGCKKGAPLKIFDTTAGLGQEAFLLAALGNEITLFERHPILIALLKDGLHRSAADPSLVNIVSRMKLIEGCAITYFKSQALINAPDVIYCDPMFEKRTKSSLVKKEMQMLQHIIGADEDAKELVTLARQYAKKRVVVKRPHHAKALLENPSIVLNAKSHRFDIYLCA